MNTYGLPAETIEFLRSGKQLEYLCDNSQVGKIKLISLDEIELTHAEVRSIYTEWEEIDPYEELEGHYIVPAVNLVAESDLYDPIGILGWLPDYSSFGTWDNDHEKLMLFKGATWKKITRNPLKYLDEQWDPKGVGCYPKLWLKHDFFVDDCDWIIKAYPGRCELHNTRLKYKLKTDNQHRAIIKQRHLEEYLENKESKFPYPGVPVRQWIFYLCPKCSREEIKWLKEKVSSEKIADVHANKHGWVKCPFCGISFKASSKQS